MSNRSPTRSRRRHRGDGRLRAAAIVLGIAAVVALPLAMGTMAYTSTTLGRTGAIDVVQQTDGALDLDTVSSVTVGNRQRLVTIINRLNRGTAVTVSILSGPGTLYTSGGSGSSVTFSLSKGASNTVDIEAGGTGGDTITYQIQASGAGLTATATRSVQTLSSGQAAPGYPSEFNDGRGGIEPGENASIPPANPSMEISNFANMQQANDGNAYADIESYGASLDVGVAHRDPPDSVTEYELQIRYRTPSWDAGVPTVNIVDASGNVFQSSSLSDTNGVWETAVIALNDAAENFVNSNDVLYVTYTGPSGSRLDVDFQRIQKDPPPPVAEFSVSCNGKDCTFDASASTGYSHPIVEYRWQFGDGSSRTTSNSVTSHTYASNGTYNVKLTVETSTGETNSTSRLLTVGNPQPTFVPPDVYDDIEDWSGEPDAADEDSSIPPPNPSGNKISNFGNVMQIDGATAELPGGPFNIGIATRGISGSGSNYELLVRYALDDWESNVDVMIVDGSNSLLQTYTLTPTGGSLQNATIDLNSAVESYVRNKGKLYVRYDSQGGGWVTLDLDAHLVKIEP